MGKNAEPIVVEQAFHAPVDVVWNAITDKIQMRQWFFETINDFDPVPGSETQFNVRVQDQDYTHLWKVTEVIPKRRIAYSWRYGGYPGDSFVVWDLSETTNGTKLKFTHKGHETFPQDNPVFSRESGQAGWHYFICERLKAFVEQQNS